MSASLDRCWEAPSTSWTAITSGTRFLARAPRNTAGAAAAGALLYIQSNGASKDCLREVWTNERTGDMVIIDSKLVTALKRDDDGSISAVAGRNPDGSVWTLRVDEALALMDEGLPFFTVDNSSRVTRIVRRRRLGVPYLATRPNRTVADNLDRLAVLPS